MKAEDYLKAASLDDALQKLQEEIRQKPSEVRLRRFLFQLLCVLGQWERAMTQLSVINELETEASLLVPVFRSVLNCEALRLEVFAGKRTPLVFGEPAEWVSWLVQANQLIATGQDRAGDQLRAQAFDAAPAVAGRLNGQPFDWVADADTRLGPVLEAIIEGKYYWVPFCRIHKIETVPPSDLRDLVWQPATFVWANGGQAVGYIPTRYPGTEQVSDHALRLARKTDWLHRGDDLYIGLGQRVLATDVGETPLLEVRTLELDNPVSAPTA